MSGESRWHPQPELELKTACKEGSACETERMWPAINYLLHARMIPRCEHAEENRIASARRVAALAQGILLAAGANGLNPNEMARACFEAQIEGCRQLEYFVFRTGTFVPSADGEGGNG